MKGQVTAPLVGSMASSHIFKIMFVNQGKVYEVYARKVSQGRLFGFIEIEELVFGERSTVVRSPKTSSSTSMNPNKRPWLTFRA